MRGPTGPRRARSPLRQRDEGAQPVPLPLAGRCRGGRAPARDARPPGSASCPSLPPLPPPLPPGRRTRAPAQAPAPAAMAMRQTPLTCSGHTRPVVDLAFSGVTPYGYFLISACKGERDGPLCSGSPRPGGGRAGAPPLVGRASPSRGVSVGRDGSRGDVPASQGGDSGVVE